MKIFITGIGTDVGKTLVSAIVVQALEADYWKPIQAGDLNNSDSHKVKSLLSFKDIVIPSAVEVVNPNVVEAVIPSAVEGQTAKWQLHPNSYALNTPASPHYAAQLDGIKIDLKQIIEPNPEKYRENNHLVIEGAGGVLVPLNETDCVIDLIQKDYKVIVVSRHYLGSINHTLLTIEALKSRKINIAGIIFSGDENKATEEIILKKTGAKFIGRIDNEPYFDANVVRYYADLFRDNLLNL